MANQWFRMYSEFATDPKVQMMSEQNQRRLTMLFCMRCNVTTPLQETLQDNHVTFQLRISNEEWFVTKGIFIENGFIDDNNKLLNWDKRQYVSDSSSKRVAKHREAKKNNVTLCNVSVTDPEQNITEHNRTKHNITETDKNISSKRKETRLDSCASDPKKNGFDEFWLQYPTKKNKQDAIKAWIKLKPDEELQTTIMAHVIVAKAKDADWINGFSPHAATYLNGKRWEDEIKLEKVKKLIETKSQQKTNSNINGLKNLIYKTGVKNENQLGLENLCNINAGDFGDLLKGNV